MLALINTLHSRKAFSFLYNRTKVIMQVFTTIELYSGDNDFMLLECKRIWKQKYQYLFLQTREAILVRGARMAIVSTGTRDLLEIRTFRRYSVDQKLRSKTANDCSVFDRHMTTLKFMKFLKSNQFFLCYREKRTATNKLKHSESSNVPRYRIQISRLFLQY